MEVSKGSWYVNGIEPTPEHEQRRLETINKKFTDFINLALENSKTHINAETGDVVRRAAIYSESEGILLELDDADYDESVSTQDERNRSTAIFKCQRIGDEYRRSFEMIKENQESPHISWKIDPKGENPTYPHNLFGKTSISPLTENVLRVLNTPDAVVVLYGLAFPPRN